ncbi:MAG: hypothetical protein M3O61_12365 [Gemmatimonadota bacterium]|nr:hypothetical protein [Gemmatimonadota bacterium]
MRRLFLGLIAVAALAACSDAPVTGTVSPTVSLAKSVPPTNALDQSIYDLIAEWPKGLSNAIMSHWTNVKRKYEDGDVAGANKKFVDAAAFILKKTPDMNEPEDETRNSAAARLLSYMALYLGGATAAPPAGTDNAVGLLMPGVPLTLLTPSGHFGAQFDGDETAEPRFIVVTQDANSYGFCAGPLPTTTRCQYPLFYDMKSIPAGPLLNPGVMGVCLDPHPEEHDDLRLAKPDASNPGDIELLEVVPALFIDCSDIPQFEEEALTDASLLGRAVHLASALASRVGKLLTPKSAYAIDQGGGGEFGDFGSPFNWVGPEEECEECPPPVD